jgi:hypothetical protein
MEWCGGPPRGAVAQKAPNNTARVQAPNMKTRINSFLGLVVLLAISTIARADTNYTTLASPSFSASGSLTNAGTWKYYRVDFPGHSVNTWRLLLSSTNASSPDLFVRRGQLPTLLSFDKASLSTPIDNMIFTRQEATKDAYYIGVLLPTGVSPCSYLLTGDFVASNYPDQPFAWTVTGTGTETWYTTQMIYKTVRAYGYGAISTSARAGVTGTASFSYSENALYNGQYASTWISPGIFSDYASGVTRYGDGTFTAYSGNSYGVGISAGGGGYASIVVKLPDHLQYNPHTATRAATGVGIGLVSASDGQKNFGGFAATPLPQMGGTVSGTTYSVLQNNPNVRLVFSDTGTTNTTNPLASLLASTISAPTISIQPNNQTVAVDSIAPFSLIASGPLLTYQWYFDDGSTNGPAALPESSFSTLTLPSVQSSNAGTYYAAINNPAGVVITTNVTLQVTPSQVLQIHSASFRNGNFSFSCPTVSNLNYQVQYTTNLTSTNWVNLGGALTATGANLSISDGDPSSKQRFYRVASPSPWSFQPVTASAASSTLTGWWFTNAFDGNLNTVWSSGVHTNANSSEYIAFWFPAFTNINFVRLTPRFHPTSHEALCFPAAFTIYYSDSTNWVSQKTVTGMLRPDQSAPVTVRFPTAHCNGILVMATTLRDDFLGNYAFQLGEAKAGFNPSY